MFNARSRIQHHGFDTDEGAILMTWREAYPFAAFIRNWPQFDRDPFKLHALALVETCKQLEEEGKVVAWAWFACICCIGSLPANRNVFLPPFVFSNAHSFLLYLILMHPQMMVFVKDHLFIASNAPLLCLRTSPTRLRSLNLREKHPARSFSLVRLWTHTHRHTHTGL